MAAQTDTAARPIASGMAGRYATALFELAIESNALDAVRADLAAFDALVEANPDLDRLVRSPAFTAAEQLAALDGVLARAGLGGVTANFLRVVTQNRRLFAVREIIRAFEALVAAHKGEITAEVTVAEPLADRHVTTLREALAAVTGRTIVLKTRVDPSIIGGLVVKVGSRMVDASLSTKLNAIKTAMKEVG